jgi:(1->4)-alpha-D-glucan 1-alpha-D-glucosylmutase
MLEAPAIRALAERTIEQLGHRRRTPESTYRIQFNKSFRFEDALAVVDYLAALGISDLYSSPYLKSRPGSLHGYDISSHSELNPEIGTYEEYLKLIHALHERGMGQILDVVPNHMGIVGNQNVWWNDVLENGPASPYANYFDIDWHSPKADLDKKVLLPVLGEPYGKALESQQLRLVYDSGAFSIHYFDHVFPVSPSTYDRVLRHRLSELESTATPASPELAELLSVVTAIGHLPPAEASTPDKIAERQREKEVIKRRINALVEGSPAIAEFVRTNVQQFNGCEGDCRSLDLLHDLLDAQPYRLSSWRVASDEINYRRFFDINELAALSMEKPEVFASTHEFILRLICEGQVNGLRIDHPDGLFDPRQYLRRLQTQYSLHLASQLAKAELQPLPADWESIKCQLEEALSDAIKRRPLYVVVEKILGKDEPIPGDWPTEGTTGYDFLKALNELFVDQRNTIFFTRLYRQQAKMRIPLRDLIYQKKYLTLQVSLSSELQMLALTLDRLSEHNRSTRDLTLNSLRRALREVIACLEVYRTYVTGPDISERDARVIERAVAQAKRRNPTVSGALFDFVKDTLLLRSVKDSAEDVLAEQLRFVGKFQQLSAPVMAKGVEDTVFYIYNRLISLNEVGGDPGQFGSPLDTLHDRNLQRLHEHPRALLATATHDTKRGEDARVRISVLSEMPEEWRAASARWHKLNRKHTRLVEDERVPDRNEEYLFYQTLIGAWPRYWLLKQGVPTDVTERIQAYMQKAVHEAKVHTSWVNPNPAFDQAIGEFVARVLDPEKNAAFLKDFEDFLEELDHFALFNCLSQVLLKVASPGVPDIYQGTEFRDFSLVDPDNRRPVDFSVRRRCLEDLDQRANENKAKLLADLISTRSDDAMKMYILSRALRCRRDLPGLFCEGEYFPAVASEPFADHVCAFIRRQGTNEVLVCAPRLLRRVFRSREMPIGAAWRDATLHLPNGTAGRRWRDVFSDETLTTVEANGAHSLSLAGIFRHFPVALLRSEN